MSRKQIDIIGAPFNGIGVRPEQENPAQAIRDAGLVSALEQRGASVSDFGDVPIPQFGNLRRPDTGILNQSEYSQVCQSLAITIIERQRQDSALIVLGGDCSITLGAIGAFCAQKKPIGVVYLDAHTDFMDPRESSSGEPADYPLWILTGRGPKELTKPHGPSPLLHDENIVIYGYRDPCVIEQSRIHHYSRERIAELGLEESIDWGMSHLSSPELSLWLHLDVDVIDPSEMPAVHFPEHEGLSMDEVSRLVGSVLNRKNAMGISVACYHNDSDPGGAAAKRIVSLLADSLT